MISTEQEFYKEVLFKSKRARRRHIQLWKREILPLTKKINFKKILCHIYKQEFDEEYNEDISYCKVQDTVITQRNIEGCFWYI